MLFHLGFAVVSPFFLFFYGFSETEAKDFDGVARLRGRSNSSSHHAMAKLSSPSPIDWRDRNVVTRVKKQDSEHCWAYATAAAIESRWMIHEGKTTNIAEDDAANSLHPAQFVNCRPNAAGGGLIGHLIQHLLDNGGGGIAEEAIWYAEGVGNSCGLGGETTIGGGSAAQPGNDLCMMDDYDPSTDGCGSAQLLSRSNPYCSMQQTCHNKIPRGRVHSEFDLTEHMVHNLGAPMFDVEDIKNYLQSGPITAAVCSGDPNFREYNHVGVYHESKFCEVYDTDHVISIIGWNDTQADGHYWIVKNSWGTDWGSDGFAFVGLNDFGIRRMISVPKIIDEQRCTRGDSTSTEYDDHQEPGVVYHKLNLRSHSFSQPPADDQWACHQWCISNERCRSWTFRDIWSGKTCFLHDEYDSTSDAHNSGDHYSAICRP